MEGVSVFHGERSRLDVAFEHTMDVHRQSYWNADTVGIVPENLYA